MIYFDHASSSPMEQSTIDFLFQAFKKDRANPSSKHSLGKQLSDAIHSEREKIFKTLFPNSTKEYLDGCKLIFTSSTSEANNQIICSLKKYLKEKAKKSVFFAADHKSLMAPHEDFEDQNQLLCLNSMQDLICPATGSLREEYKNEVKDWGLICLTEVNSQSGLRFDVEKLARELRELNPLLHIHVDGVQAFGRVRFGLEGLDINSYTFSSHKLGGPKGIAALILMPHTQVKALIKGGDQQHGLRASAESLGLILTFSYIIQERVLHSEYNEEHITHLNCHLLKKLEEVFGRELILPFQKFETTPYILTFALKNVFSDLILCELGEKEIYLSSHCAGVSDKNCQKNSSAENVFSALKIAKELHSSIFRVSLGICNTKAEVDTFIEALREAVQQSRSVAS